MSPSRPLFIGMDVHHDSIAVAYVAQAHGAEGTYLGSIGPRQGDLDHLLRKMQAKANHLIFVYEAGPCGYWLYRYPMNKGSDCWAIASKPTAGTPCHSPAWRALELSPLLMSLRWQTKPCVISRGHVPMPSALSKTPRSVSTPACSATIAGTGAGLRGARPPALAL
jgi:hypothetical protein